MNTISPRAHSVGWQVLVFLGWVVLCFSAAAGAYFVSIDGWYVDLHKPTWNPPAWVFGPAWTVLYLMMAVAAWLVWRQGGWQRQRLALTVFLAQWVLNAFWTPLFFGLHRLGWAFAEIVLLWFTLAATLVLFWRAQRIAGLMLVPYLAWVTFAATLNFTIWRMNS
jgi:translocator protein